MKNTTDLLEGDKDFWKRENWIMLPTHGIHTCSGVPEAELVRHRLRLQIHRRQNEFDPVQSKSKKMLTFPLTAG